MQSHQRCWPSANTSTGNVKGGFSLFSVPIHGLYSSGRPSDEKAMNTELTCLKGFTPKSFNDLVQMQVHGGYPIGEKGIEAESL